MDTRTRRIHRLLLTGAALCLALCIGCATAPPRLYVSAPPAPDGDIVIRVASAQDTDPFAAGKAAAEALRERMGATMPKAVIMAECFEEETQKREVLKGVTSVLPKDLVFGLATYGSFAHEGCLDLDSVSLMGIGGDGIAVAGTLAPRMDIAGLTMEDDLALLQDRLRSAGADLAGAVPRTDDDRLLILMADAHSPKNQFLVEGAQSVVGNEFPITGGSANKNAGQTFVYYAGRMYTDAAVALMLSGDFDVALAGRQAKDNDAVITTAQEAADEARQGLTSKPFAAIAFNCAGRKGKLDRIEDELTAMQKAMGTEAPLFGCYCAGEIGPADQSEQKPGVLSTGVGWHVMFTMLGRD